MPDGSTLLLFSAAALALLLMPGPAVLYIVNRSITQGAKAGLVSVAGIHAGTILHVTAGVLGLSALLVASSTAFTVVKVAGALYLIWMGAQAWSGSGPAEVGAPGPIRPLRRVFMDGVLVNTFNPKTAVFFLAFVPQFVDHSRPDTSLQLVTLGGFFIALGIVSDGAYAFASGAIAEWVGRHPTSGRYRGRASGTVLIGLGVAALFSRSE